MANNHITGSRVRMTFKVDNVPQTVRGESIDYEENSDEGVDEVCGEDAGRPWIVSDYHTITIKAYVADLQILDTWLADSANQNAALADLEKSATLKFRLSNGTSAQYQLTECTRSPLQISISGRKSRVMMNYKLRARFMRPVAGTGT